MLRTRFLFLILAVLVLAARPTPAQTSVGTYGAYWLGLPVGTVTLNNAQSGGGAMGDYAFSMTLQSGGILGSSRFTTTFSSRGGYTGPALSPNSGHFADIRRGVTRTETIEFRDGLPRFTSVPLYLVPPEFQFNLELARGSLDPSSSLYLLLHSAAEGVCTRSFRVYDGFSLYEAQISDRGTDQVRTDFYTGPAQKCRLSLSPIAGKAAVFGALEIPEMEVSVARLSPGAPAIPVSGTLFINGNRAGLRLQGFEVR